MSLRLHALHSARVAAGFSLVELMVAMTLSLILLAGALSILYSTKLTSAENERVARVQEAGRTAFELIRQDARAAGYVGCARPQIDPFGNSTFASNTLNNNGMLWNFASSVYGYDATSLTAWNVALDAAIPASPAPAGGNDILVLRIAPPGSTVFRTNAFVTGSADIQVDRDPTTALAADTALVGTPMIISDCSGAEVFVATTVLPVGAIATVSHATSTGGASIGNNANTLAHSYQKGALLQPVETVIYYIASCTAIGPQCTSLTPPGLWEIVGSGSPQELIEGVEGMQITYGVDTDNDLLANTYVTADAVTDWTRVVSVNLAILVRSIDEYGTEVDTQRYKLLGGDPVLDLGGVGARYGPFNDRRSRRVFTTTITLRNSTT